MGKGIGMGEEKRGVRLLKEGVRERRCLIYCGGIGRREERCCWVSSSGWLFGGKSMFHSRSLLAVAAAIAISACSALKSGNWRR